jgi:hypothetical protein
MGNGPKAAHHRGSYQVRARAVVQAARANPNTRCWRCGLTLAQHAAHHNGRRPTWQAGHLIDGQINGALRPEASTCNTSAGATLGNRQRTEPHTEHW